MTAASSVPAVKAALVALWSEGLLDSQVFYGPASTPVNTSFSRTLAVGRASGTHELSGMTLDGLTEQYQIECQIAVEMAGAEQRTADEMAWRDYQAADLALRAAGPQLGLLGTISVTPTGDFDAPESSGSVGVRAAVKFTVRVSASS